MKKLTISIYDIKAITGNKTFYNELKVIKISTNVYKIIGYRYGEEQVKLIGYAHEVAEYLNSYYGIERQIQPLKEGK